MKLQSRSKLEDKHQRMKSTALNMTQPTGGILDLTGSGDGKVIGDEEANDIYQRLLAQNSKR